MSAPVRFAVSWRWAVPGRGMSHADSPGGGRTQDRARGAQPERKPRALYACNQEYRTVRQVVSREVPGV